MYSDLAKDCINVCKIETTNYKRTTAIESPKAQHVIQTVTEENKVSKEYHETTL
jgi:hypothetical protein